MNPVDLSIVSYIVQEITGKKGSSDSVSFLWDQGSIHNTIPATPVQLRGSDLFKKLKHLPPKPKYTGTMLINRQGGEVKSWTFLENT